MRPHVTLLDEALDNTVAANWAACPGRARGTSSASTNSPGSSRLRM